MRYEQEDRAADENDVEKNVHINMRNHIQTCHYSGSESKRLMGLILAFASKRLTVHKTKI